MLSGDQCINGVSELAEGHTYIRGRCKQLGHLYSPTRDDGRGFSNSDYEILLHADEFGSPVDAIEKQPEDICRRVSMTPGEGSNDHAIETPTNELPTPVSNSSERRPSRDIGVQAFSVEIEEEKKLLIDDKTEQQLPSPTPLPPPPQPSSSSQTKPIESKRKDFYKCQQSEPYVREHRPSILLRRESCHFHKLISPRNEIFVAHCSSPLVEYTESFDKYKSHHNANTIDIPNSEYTKQCYCFDHCHDSMDSTETAHRYSTSSSDSSTITKIAVENVEAIPTMRRPSKWKSSLVYFMDPCIEDSTENAAEGEYNEKEQTKPLLEHQENRNEAIVTTSFEKRSNYRKKSVEDIKSRSVEGCATRNVEGIELANDAVCPFGLAKNLEKQICIIPSRKKKSSGRPSFLKLVTLILIGSAILITSAAIKEAYY